MNSLSLCRICLEDGAALPIFDKNDNQDICSKLSMCLNEKFENIEGYPQNICEDCNNTLDSICNFINKYKESCKVLQSGLSLVKQENEDRYSECSYNEHSEIEIEIKDVKKENIIHFDDNTDLAAHLTELIKPLKVKTKISIKNELIKKQKKKCKDKGRINKIASSLLEGDFTWTGEKWCLKTSNTIPKDTGARSQRQKEIVIKKPKLPTKPLSKLCDICGEVLETQEKLWKHKRKIHLKNPVKCAQCPRICSSELNLRRHISRRHAKVKNFVCSICGKEYAYQGELRRHHKVVHEKKIKPKKVFSCKLCNKSYKCAKSVLIHERSVHTGQRPAVCTVCSASFYHEDYLKEHMRLHTGEAPFKCPVCGRGYAQLGNMKSHLRIHKLSELDADTLNKIRPNYLKLLKK